MKRNHVARFESLSRIFPLFFWRFCSKCKQEFRREWGWSALVGTRKLRFLCRECAPVREDADRFFINHKEADKLYLQSGQFTSTLKTSEPAVRKSDNTAPYRWMDFNTPEKNQ